MTREKIAGEKGHGKNRRMFLKRIIGGAAVAAGGTFATIGLMDASVETHEERFAKLRKIFPTFRGFAEAVADDRVKIGRHEQNGVPVVDALLYFAIDTAEKDIEPAIRPPVDEKKFWENLRRVVDPVRKKVAESNTFPEQLEAIASRIYDEEKFEFRKVRGDIVSLLENKKGNCEDLTALYLILTDECGIDACPINLPGHLFPRVRGKRAINIETTDYGLPRTNEEIKEAFLLHETALEKGVYLADRPMKSILTYALLNRAQYIGRRAVEVWDQEKGGRLFKKLEGEVRLIMKLDPDIPQIITTLSGLRMLHGDVDVEDGLKRAIDLDPNYLPAYFALGVLYEKKGEKRRAYETHKRGAERGTEMKSKIGEKYKHIGRSITEVLPELEKQEARLGKELSEE